MGILPSSLLHSLQNVPGFNQEAFENVHASGGQVTSVRLNPFKWPIVNSEGSIVNEAGQIIISQSSGNAAIHHSPFTIHQQVPWSSCGYYLSERPSFTFDPVFHAGGYYVQEASSMFLEQALKQTIDLSQPLRVLDLCAAPGGKSTLLQSLMSEESLLVSNEVIKSRAAVLEENITKWGANNVVVTNNDPAHFARLQNYFDVIVVDAPCSGSGLFRRDPDAINEWSENNVQLCSQRQQRIIADVWPALKKDGVMIYSTCSYSQEEDESIADWVAEGLKGEGLRLKLKEEWDIVETFSAKHHIPGYRFYPDKVKGEGFFITAIQKKDGDIAGVPGRGKKGLEKITKHEELVIKPRLKEKIDLIFFKQKEQIIALPAGLEQMVLMLQSVLYIKKAGVELGKIAGKELVPEHALALSTIISSNTPHIQLNKQQALQYLRRDELQLNAEHKGWAMVTYEGFNLGWIKILQNRINNYYPKEWRILKQNI